MACVPEREHCVQEVKGRGCAVCIVVVVFLCRVACNRHIVGSKLCVRSMNRGRTRACTGWVPGCECVGIFLRKGRGQVDEPVLGVFRHVDAA